MEATNMIGYEPKSAYRKKEARYYLSLGFADFRVVDSLTPYRGAPAVGQIAEDQRSKYIVICRPATSGRYGKSVQHRVVLAG